MRGASVILGTLITLTIAIGSQAAMSSDLRNATRGMEQREGILHRALDPVWNGGTLAPVVIEVAPLKAPRAAVRVTPRTDGASPTRSAVTVRIT